MKKFILFIIFIYIENLSAPPLVRGGLKCEKFLNICKFDKNKCKKHSSWALAFTANVGNNTVNIDKNTFFEKLLKHCQKSPNLFIENLAIKIDLSNK